MGSPQRGAKCGKKLRFRPIEKHPAQMPYRRLFESIRRGGPRPRQYAGGGIRGVLNNIGRRRSLLIILTATSSLHICDTEDAVFAIVEPITTMRVQNYADSRINVLLLRLTRALFAIVVRQ